MRLLKLIISLHVFAYDCFKRIAFKVMGKRYSSAVVLYYHSVTREQRPAFAKQMDTLLKMATPFFADVGRFPHCADNRQAAVTFDDGLQSVIENALPELKARCIPVTLFVPSGCLGEPPSWIKDPDYRDQVEVVIPTAMLELLKEDSLVHIGSHSVTHSNLLHLEDHEVRTEICQSKNDLEDIVDREIRGLSFPFGGFKSYHVTIAREAGYKRVFSISPTVVSCNSHFIVGRVLTDPSDSILEFKLKICGAYRWQHLASHMKSKIRAVLSKA